MPSLSSLLSRRRRWLWLISAILLSVLAAEGLHRVGLTQALDQRVQDLWFQWQGRVAPPRHVAIVAIDEATLAAYPDEPMVFWTDKLALTAQRLRLAGASVVGFDILLSISPERWFARSGGAQRDQSLDYDRALREEIHTGRLILVAARMGSGDKASDYLMPSPDYLLALPGFDVGAHIGLADLVDDSDGVVRRFAPSPRFSGNRAMALAAPKAGVEPTDGAAEEDWPTLGLPTLLALRARGADPRAADWVLADQPLSRTDAPRPIAFCGPPGTVPVLSMQSILDGSIDDASLAAAVRDRVVLVGLGAGFGDDHYAPYTSSLALARGPLMSGVEIHAQVVESLLAGRQLVAASPIQRLALLLTVAWLMASLGMRGNAWLGVASLAGGWLVLLGLGYGAFRLGSSLPVVGAWLVGALAMALTLVRRLTGEERERARLRSLFGRYVSEHVVAQVLASSDRPALGGQTQTITVLFTDIRGFTTLSEKLQAHEVVELLNTYFERACKVLLAHGGSIDKFIGDAIMVEFGSPLATPDHARQAVRAALALKGVAEDFATWVAERFAGRDLAPFGVGIGLHTGEAVIGNVGASMRMEFTAIGDTVNLASRLEGHTRVMGCTVLASAATVAAAGPGVRCGRDAVIQVKGRAESVHVYEISGFAEAS